MQETGGNLARSVCLASLCLQREGFSFLPGIEKACLKEGFLICFRGEGQSDSSAFPVFSEVLQLKIVNRPRFRVFG